MLQWALLPTKLIIMYVKMKVAQSCPTLCDHMDYTVRGVLQGRTLEWVAFPFSRGSSRPRDRAGVLILFQKSSESVMKYLWYREGVVLRKEG